MKERKNIYFLSDFHLGVDAKETSLEREKKIVRFLQSIEDKAERVFLLGDVFDFWFEYKRVVPKGFVRLFGQLVKMTDMGIKIDFFCGNHDLWQRDYFSKEMNITVHREKVEEFLFDGKVFLVGHGDGLDKKDYMYRIIRFLFKNSFCNLIFSSIPANIGLWLANTWSSMSRHSHGKSDFEQNENEPMIEFCKNCLKQRKIDYFVFGHRHLVMQEDLSDGKARYFNTGSWLYESSYLVWDGKNAEMKSFD
ncbi:MAG: UDP-2,3-diacylglucosamine diphosphatase [Bacteroidales bacterium]|nr:UDP-2,3-diacylglucosamine diphosphatase [Bacteroidales bacterium]